MEKRTHVVDLTLLSSVYSSLPVLNRSLSLPRHPRLQLVQGLLLLRYSHHSPPPRRPLPRLLRRRRHRHLSLHPLRRPRPRFSRASCRLRLRSSVREGEGSVRRDCFLHQRPPPPHSLRDSLPPHLPQRDNLRASRRLPRYHGRPVRGRVGGGKDRGEGDCRQRQLH